jgi:hypothetical protein
LTWPADVVKKSGTVPAEIIAGHQQIKPSQKAKHAAGINSSDEEESNDGLEGEPAHTGSKCKVGKKASSASTKKQKPNEVPKTKCKRAHVDSEDVESTDKNAGDMEDQADAYEQLRLERETDQPVCGEIRIVLAIANISFSGQKKVQFSWQ